MTRTTRTGNQGFSYVIRDHDVFEYCRDPHHLFEGWPALEVTDVDPTPEGVGTKAPHRGQVRERVMVEQIEREYTEFVPDERIVSKAHAKVRFAGRTKEVASGPIFHLAI